jgi:hypothetical protein
MLREREDFEVRVIGNLVKVNKTEIIYGNIIVQDPPEIV